MKITFISDTHTRQEYMDSLPGGDILIFSGDCMGSGFRKHELIDFIEWIKEQPYKYKVCIAGNHDRYCENESQSIINNLFEKYSDDGVIYLRDSMTEIEGLKIYGTPYQPYFWDWAFNISDSKSLYNIYKMIPEDIDILVTHCPPYDILDKSHISRPFYGRTGEEPLGSDELLSVLIELGEHKPRYHSFGHIHGDGGKTVEIDGTTYINASVCDEAYNPVNPIITLNIEPRIV